jgi:hypothetical protein
MDYEVDGEYQKSVFSNVSHDRFGTQEDSTKQELWRTHVVSMFTST